MPSRPPKTDTQGKGVAVGARAVSITGKHLTLEQVVRVARCSVPVQISAAGRARAATAHKTMLALKSRRPVYGQSTGVGSNKDTWVPEDASVSHGLGLLRSHAAGAGPPVSTEHARAMMVVRLNQLAVGGSGVHPRLLDALAQALNRRLTAPLRRFGAIGTGDITSLATAALCILGEKPWNGGTMLPYPFEASDALPFMSSNAATLGEAVLAHHDIDRRLRTGLSVAGLTHIAMGGSAEAYSAAVHNARPHAGQSVAATELRQLLDPDIARPERRIQDSYGLRALPQVQGAALDAAAELEGVLLVDINSACENPFVSIRDGKVFHNGNFHSIYVGLAMDKLRSALYAAASLATARIGGLMNPGNTNLRPFLAEGPAASSGVLIVEYLAHSALAELRHLAAQDSLGNAVLSHGTEEHASFATQSAWHATRSVPVYETILACELLAAVRALKQQELVPQGTKLRGLYEAAVLALERATANKTIDMDITALINYLQKY